jgi:hypothetical protein
MLRKLTIAFATAATLGAAVLAPTAASAGGFIWHPHHHHHHWGPGIGIGFVGGGYDCYRTRLVLTPYGYRYRTINVCATDRIPVIVSKKPRSRDAAAVFGACCSAIFSRAESID